MAQNRWQDRDHNQGGSGGRGSWERGEDFEHGERQQHHGLEESQEREGFGQGGPQSQQGGGQQRSGDWGRMGRYAEESGQGGGQGRWGQGGNYRMDRDFGQSGSRGGSQGNYGGASQGGMGGFGGAYEGIGRPYVGESSSSQGRGGSWGGGSGGYGGRSGFGGSQSQQDRGFIDKASDEVSSWFGDDQARRRREQDEHRGRGPKGYTRSDERIREDVNDKLTDDGWLDASDIEVQVSSSEVTLTGQVKSREEKRRAEDIVEAVSGVKHVQNNLRVKDRNAISGQTSTTQFGSSGSSSAGSKGSSS